MGLVLAVVVHPADIQDREGAKRVIDRLLGKFPRLRLIWAAAGYAGKLVEWVMVVSGWVLVIVKRPRNSQRFEVLPRRWVVERTLAWLGRGRRLSKDDEALAATAEGLGATGNGAADAPAAGSVVACFGNTLLENRCSPTELGESRSGTGDAHCERQTHSAPNKAQLPRFLRLQLLQWTYSADVKSLYNA